LEDQTFSTRVSVAFQGRLLLNSYKQGEKNEPHLPIDFRPFFSGLIKKSPLTTPSLPRLIHPDPPVKVLELHLFQHLVEVPERPKNQTQAAKCFGDVSHEILMTSPMASREIPMKS